MFEQDFGDLSCSRFIEMNLVIKYGRILWKSAG